MKKLQPNYIVKSDRGEWLLIVSVYKTMAVVEKVGGSRGMIQISHLLPSTSRKLFTSVK